MFSAISLASISGFLISTMFRLTSEPVILARSPRSFSMSAPFLPITTPGRAEWMVTRAFLAGRSMMTRLTPACDQALLQVILQPQILMQELA